MNTHLTMSVYTLNTNDKKSPYKGTGHEHAKGGQGF